jgi:hypothetical protein
MNVTTQYRPDPSTVIFLHVPKTAGTTLHKIIERQYRPENTLTMLD